jgi:SpoVK/Ycf46/Vps4 family AAA+-type ATPase
MTPKLQRWTRDGLLNLPWGPFESFERLVLSPHFRERLAEIAQRFRGGGAAFHDLELPWRQGLFLFGPSGAGKSAASRAVARALEWDCLAIPAHEILDTHLFERAMAEACSRPHRVIVLEDVDQTIRHMEPADFFTLLDHAQARADGTFWVATSRNAEAAPKTQLIRPGRFDESIRLDAPAAPLRRELMMNLLVPYLSASEEQETALDEQEFATLVEDTQGLSFAHFEEMRQIAARLKLAERQGEAWTELRSYVQDQIIARDRWGGLSDITEEVGRRVNEIDPRVLKASLDMTDVFRTLMEKVIGDAAAQAKDKQAEEGDAP